MCGIVGIIGREAVAGGLIESLKRLEYRGYDSAGVATNEKNGLTRICAEGKIKNLEAKLSKKILKGKIGIGHTRWATHGKPTETNAHPHATERLAVVHNGIIENYKELREELERVGRVFKSETDTEVIAHLVTLHMNEGKAPKEAIELSLPRFRGAFAIAMLFAGYDDLLIVARKGSPLAIGYGKGEMFVGSDAIALSDLTDKISYLEDGDYALLTRDTCEMFDKNGTQVKRSIKTGVGTKLAVDKGNYRHFMSKEIHEQPEVVEHTLDHYCNSLAGRIILPGSLDFSTVDRIGISACGTAYYAGLVAKYWFSKYARLAVDMDVASEARYLESPLTKNTLSIVISQSGETADTLALLRYAKAGGQRVVGIINVPSSTMAREADLVLPTRAGPEISVAASKSFTCQLAALACMVVKAGKDRKVLTKADEKALVAELQNIPAAMSQALKLEEPIQKIARELSHYKDALYLGRGTCYALAFEGALKLKEVTYIHAEGYGAGELKHGPIALLDERMPVIVLAPREEPFFEKTISNLEEANARGAPIFLFSDKEGCDAAKVPDMRRIELPTMHPLVAPFGYAVALQLLAYLTACEKGTDPDQPRNLAKSVTVE